MDIARPLRRHAASKRFIRGPCYEQCEAHHIKRKSVKVFKDTDAMKSCGNEGNWPHTASLIRRKPQGKHHHPKDVLHIAKACHRRLDAGRDEAQPGISLVVAGFQPLTYQVSLSCTAQSGFHKSFESITREMHMKGIHKNSGVSHQSSCSGTRHRLRSTRRPAKRHKRTKRLSMICVTTRYDTSSGVAEYRKRLPFRRGCVVDSNG